MTFVYQFYASIPVKQLWNFMAKIFFTVRSFLHAISQVG